MKTPVVFGTSYHMWIDGVKCIPPVIDLARGDVDRLNKTLCRLWDLGVDFSRMRVRGAQVVLVG